MTRRDLLRALGVAAAAAACRSSSPPLAVRTDASGVRLAPLMTLRLEISAREPLYVAGGVFEGARLRGRVVRGEWLITNPDAEQFELRLALETDAREALNVRMHAVVASSNELHTTARFETAASKLAYLNSVQAIGKARQVGGLQIHTLEMVV